MPPVPDVLRSGDRPATCVAARCSSLYTYDDARSGIRYMGCAHSVFATEIDVALFEEAERGRGYGSLKLAREPLTRCAFTIEKAHESPEFRCRNRRFADFPEAGPGAVRAFDLRHGLEAA